MLINWLEIIYVELYKKKKSLPTKYFTCVSTVIQPSQTSPSFSNLPFCIPEVQDIFHENHPQSSPFKKKDTILKAYFKILAFITTDKNSRFI